MGQSLKTAAQCLRRSSAEASTEAAGDKHRHGARLWHDRVKMAVGTIEVKVPMQYAFFVYWPRAARAAAAAAAVEGVGYSLLAAAVSGKLASPQGDVATGIVGCQLTVAHTWGSGGAAAAQPGLRWSARQLAFCLRCAATTSPSCFYA